MVKIKKYFGLLFAILKRAKPNSAKNLSKCKKKMASSLNL